MPQSLPCFVGTPNTIFYSKNGTCYPIQHHADGIENNKPTKPSMQFWNLALAAMAVIAEKSLMFLIRSW